MYFMSLCVKGIFYLFQQIHIFCDVYEHARHHYTPFLEPQLNNFNVAFDVLKSQVRFKHVYFQREAFCEMCHYVRSYR